MNHGHQRVINVYASAQCPLSTINKEEQKLCKSYNGKTYQKYRLILVFKPFLLVSMIQRLSKKLGNSTTLGNYGLCPAALI
ncbi:hypothetical protein AW119_21530 [Escherichia coli]|nr:hypothetical protein [Escherichia coli]EGD6067225.1 hypothetical protein [Escherichia coli]OTD29059.1 hypothetical protein AW095_26845 [Escherichia coli]OTE47959.1 hypothetical protein AW119_21530 [Escherichia coli]OWE12189.1 hypothetical protein A8M43_23595 [Escherichia coli]